MFKKIDPFYYILRYGILRHFFSASLRKDEESFILENITKHRHAMWVTVGVSISVFISLNNSPETVINTVVSSLIAPAMLTGSAWFAISFGGIPAKLINIALSVTFWLFMAFLASLTTMFIAVGFVTPPLLWPALVIIYTGVLVSCIQYDTADSLKAGLDEAILKHSRAALTYYKNTGIDVDK